MAMYIVKPWYRKKDDAIYGAEWAGGSDPSWVRTDAAVGFSNPNPYYSGMSTTPSSPFDNIMPWSGMRRVTDANAGELVEIPKFYYKWTRDGVKMKLQISMSQFDGSYVSPAHADRGDGVGERDYVYVGRYHCASDYKSKTQVYPVGNITRANFRSYIHNLGSNIWQWDYAMYWTICILYLVEFANWNSQAKIGYGCGNNSSIQSVGASDVMPYHTGTIQSSRSTYGIGVQYRYIEGLWETIRMFVDGIYTDASTSNLYHIKNPSNFSDTNGGTLVGQRATTYGWITAWNNPTVQGFEYALYPNSVVNNTSGTTYITDYCDYLNYASVFTVGGFYRHDLGTGLFNICGNITPTYAASGIGSRLMVLPSSRLAA